MHTIFQTNALPHRAAQKPSSCFWGVLLVLLLSAVTSAAVAQTNAVLSCGLNYFGAIGDSTTTDRHLLTPAYSISGIKEIAAGSGHVLALDSSGNVWAWGANSFGELGTGDTSNRTTPVLVLTSAKAIAAGGEHSMALLANGQVYAWGENFYGELGQGDTNERHSPTPVPGMSRIKSIACGYYHSLALAEDATLYAWGYNAYGQLGTLDNTDRHSPVSIAADVKAMAAGWGHTLVQQGDNSVYATGYNADGELGDGTTTNENRFYLYDPYSNPLLRPRAISAGQYTSTVVCQDGTVIASGRNKEGELGTGDYNNVLIPITMPGAANVKAVAGGQFFTIVLTADGKVLATGSNGYGQLGDNTTTSRNQLAPITNATLIGSIAAGSDDSVLLKPFTKTLATGDNSSGQLGIGGIVYVPNSTTPRAVQIGNDVIAVSVGPSGSHSLFLKADGTVWACGNNQFGQLGQGTTSSGSTIPLQVKGVGGSGFLTNIIAIAAGNFHNLALAADGTVYSWGRNSHGQLGTGDTVDRYYPVQVPSLTHVYEVACGGYQSLVLVSNGTIYDCGYNAYGQLGLGDSADHSSFNSVPSSGFTIAIAGGNFHSLDISINNSYGELELYGANFNGGLATGDTTNRYTPVLEGGTLAVAIAGGAVHSLHLNAYGQVYEAGYNGDGELGLGDNTDRHSWTYNSSLVNIIGIACGYDHSLFLDPYGHLYASGYNAYGQLGDGTTVNKNTPTWMSGAPYTTSMAGGYNHTVILTTPPVMMASVKISPNSIIGSETTTGTVTLTGLAGAGGQRVNLSYGGSSPVGLPAYVDVAPTSKTATFPITTSGVSSTTTVTIYAEHLNTVFASLTLNPPANTTIAVSDASGAVGQTVTLSAVLTRTDTNAVLSGRSLSFYVANAYVGNANTDSTGTATINYKVADGFSAGTQTIKVVRLGNSEFNGSTGTGTLTVSAADTAVRVADVSGAIGQTITLSAVLTRTTDNAPLSGRSLSFYVAGADVGTVNTDSTGTATLSYKVANGFVPGNQTITVKRLANSQYNASQGTGTLTVTAANTAVSVANVSGAAGQSVTLSATLTRTSDNAPLSGSSLSFYINNAYVATVNTNGTGTAQTSYTIPGNLSAGTLLTIKAVRLSNSQYNGSTGTGTLSVTN